ncbi:hypothetical protein ACFLY5_00230 [Patescibacteria group bacterium]
MGHTEKEGTGTMWQLPAMVIVIVVGLSVVWHYFDNRANKVVISELRTAHTAAQLFFNKNPNREFSRGDLNNAGFMSDENTTLEIKNGSKNDLFILATDRVTGESFTINADGIIKSAHSY